MEGWGWRMSNRTSACRKCNPGFTPTMGANPLDPSPGATMGATIGATCPPAGTMTPGPYPKGPAKGKPLPCRLRRIDFDTPRHSTGRKSLTRKPSARRTSCTTTWILTGEMVETGVIRTSVITQPPEFVTTQGPLTHTASGRIIQEAGLQTSISAPCSVS